MSRAFVKDADDAFEELPERPVSLAHNWVTSQGLAAIEIEIARLVEKLAEAGQDRYARANIGRDLRYWTARRGNAHVVEASSSSDVVCFGATVTIDRADGRRETFRIVGEDEADPEKGSVSHVSPLAQALMGRGAGDIVIVASAEVELVGVA